MKFPIYGKRKAMFQTTNQMLFRIPKRDPKLSHLQKITGWWF